MYFLRVRRSDREVLVSYAKNSNVYRLLNNHWILSPKQPGEDVYDSDKIIRFPIERVQPSHADKSEGRSDE